MCWSSLCILRDQRVCTYTPLTAWLAAAAQVHSNVSPNFIKSKYDTDFFTIRQAPPPMLDVQATLESDAGRSKV